MTSRLDAGPDAVNTKADVARIFPHRAAIVQAAVVDLGKLSPPPSLAHAYQQIVGARRGIAEDLNKYVAIVAAKDASGVTQLSRSYQAYKAQTKVPAESSGIRACARIT